MDFQSMLDSFTSSFKMSYVFLGLDVLIILSIVISFLIGLSKGLPKAMNNFIITCCATILFLVLLTPVSKLILGISLPSGVYQTLIDNLNIASEYIVEGTSIKSLISSFLNSTISSSGGTLGENSLELISSFSIVVVKLVLYLLAFILIPLTKLFIRIIFSIIRAILGIKLKELPKLRLFGGIVNACKYVFFFTVFFLPLFGLMSFTTRLANDLVSAQSSLEESSSQDDEQLQQSLELLNEFSDAYSTSLTKKVALNSLSLVFKTKSGLSLEERYLSEILSADTEYGKVSLLNEYASISKVLPVALRLYSSGVFDDSSNTSSVEPLSPYVLLSSEEPSKEASRVIDFNTFTDSEIEAIGSIFKDSVLLRVAIPIGLDIALSNSNELDEQTKDILTKLNSVNFDNELTVIGEMLEGFKDYKNFQLNLNDDPVNLLNNNNLINYAQYLCEKVFDLQIVTDVLLPFGIEKLDSKLKTDEKYQELDIDLSSFKTVDWKLEGKSIVGFVFIAYNQYNGFMNDIDAKINTIDFSEYKSAIINNEMLPTRIRTIFTELNKITILKDSLIPIGTKILSNKLKESKDAAKYIEEIDALSKADFSDAIVQIGEFLAITLENVQKLKIDFNESVDFEALLKNDELPKALDNVITSLLDIDVLSESLLPLVMNVLVSKLEVQESIQDFNFNFDKLRETTWKDEVLQIKNILVEVAKAYDTLNFNKDEWKNILSHEKLSTSVKSIMDQVVKSKLIKEEIIPCLANKLNAVIDEKGDSLPIDAQLLKEICSKDSILILLQDDLETVILVLQNLNSLGVFEGESELDYSNPTTQEALIDVVEAFFTLNAIDGKQKLVIDSIFNTLSLNSFFEDLGLTYDLDLVTDWDNEIAQIIKIFRGVFVITTDTSSFDEINLLSISDPSKREAIGSILSAISDCEMFGDSEFDLIESLTADLDPDYQVVFTAQDKIDIKANTWEKEVDVIFTILDRAESVENVDKIVDLNADDVYDFMLTASEGVIASKILGTLLKSVLAESVEFDLTSRDSMRDNALAVKNAIVLSQVMAAPEDLDYSNPEDVSLVVDAIEGLIETTDTALVNEMINVLMPDENFELDKEQITQAANVVEMVLNQSSQEEEFSLDDLSEEQKQMVENSEFAKAILDYLFPTN